MPSSTGTRRATTAVMSARMALTDCRGCDQFSRPDPLPPDCAIAMTIKVTSSSPPFAVRVGCGVEGIVVQEPGRRRADVHHADGAVGGDQGRDTRGRFGGPPGGLWSDARCAGILRASAAFRTMP
jgi:hypothetical protein